MMEENDAGDGLSKVAIILLLLIMSPNYTQAQDDGWLGLHQAEERETTRVTRQHPPHTTSLVHWMGCKHQFYLMDFRQHLQKQN